MQIQRKAQKFKNQIRRKQRATIMSNLRSQFYENLQQQDKRNKIIELNDYFKSPTPNIPPQILNNLCREFVELQNMEQIINKVLNSNNLINIVFATKCIQLKQLKLSQFFKKCTANLNKTNNHKQHNVQQFKMLPVTHLKCVEQVYLYFFIIYLTNISIGEAISQQSILQIREYFINYWNKIVDNGNINYQLCAMMCQRLFKYKSTIQGLNLQLQGLILVLMNENRSKQTYQLIKSVVVCDLEFKLLVCLDPVLPSFIYQGIKIEQNCQCALQILQSILSQEQFDKNIGFDYLLILKSIENQFYQTNLINLKRNIIFCFYNFTFIDDPIIKTFFSKFNYEKMYLNSQILLYQFLDFCIVVVMSYKKQDIIEKIMYGQTLKLTSKVNQYLEETNNSGKYWEIVENLLQCLKKIIDIIQAHGKINILIIDLKAIVNKLENQKWKQRQSQKQKQKQNLLCQYDNLIKKLQETE